jgi:GTP-binding protein EngB required for normal cell division
MKRRKPEFLILFNGSFNFKDIMGFMHFNSNEAIDISRVITLYFHNRESLRLVFHISDNKDDAKEYPFVLMQLNDRFGHEEK